MRNESIPFRLSASTTVIGGLILGGLAIYMLKPSTRIQRVVEQLPPKIIEKPVEKIVEVPKVVEKIVVKEVPAKAKVESFRSFHGAWREAGRKLPMFVFKQSGQSVSGALTPSLYSGTFPFAGGKAVGNRLEFAIANPTQRVHYRFSLNSNGDAEVDAWYTAEDLTHMLAIANRMALSPAQAQALRKIFNKELERVGKPVFVGLYYRVDDPLAKESR